MGQNRGSTNTPSTSQNAEYTKRLFRHTCDSGNVDAHFLEFRLLQRLSLMQLQNELAREKGIIMEKMDVSEEDLKRLRRTLHDYVIGGIEAARQSSFKLVCCCLTAIKDFKFMRELDDATLANEHRADLSQAFPEIANHPGDPFNSRCCTWKTQVPSVSDPLRSFLMTKLPPRLTYSKSEMFSRLDDYLDKKPPRDVSPTIDRIAQFVIALVGGAALLIPVLIMSFNETLGSKLATLSVAVLLFSLASAVGFQASNTEVMISTATYAAVLVVFVGSSLS